MVKAKIKAKEQIVIEAVMAEVSQCRADIAQLQKAIDRLSAANDRSINGFCLRRGFSLAHFYNLQAKNKAPRVTEAGKRKQITEKDEREWEKALPLAEKTTNGKHADA